MNGVSERIKNLSPDKVDILLKRLRPGMNLSKDAAATEAPARPANRFFREELDDNFYLAVNRPGNIDSLSFKTRPRRPLNPDHLEIEVEASCLNFRDIAVTLGIYPTPPNGLMPELGCDGAGRVVAVGSDVTRFKVGDEVFFLGVDGTFARYARSRERSTFLKPPSWSFEQAAGLALVIITVGYSLQVPGRLIAGERILIHSAAGGVGLAAVQMARALGAEIYATAGTKEKHDYLKSIGVPHVMDSRSLSWVDDIRTLTNGEGVDLVLNSLAGPAIDHGLSVLRPDGRFIELGKRDLVPGRMVDMAPFAHTLVFAAVDTWYIYNLFPQRLDTMIEQLRAWLVDGTLQPLPTRTYPVADITEAFRYMTTGQHIGRIAVSMKSGPILVPATARK